jgi:hypothetical protein
VTEGELGLGVRHDIAVLGEEQVDLVRVDSDAMLSFEPINFGWSNGLRVTLEPFMWDKLTLRIKGSGAVEWQPLIDWFEKWHAEPDTPRADPWAGVVHFLSDPEVVADSIELVADLGSAPVATFEELLDAVRACGADSVRCSLD